MSLTKDNALVSSTLTNSANPSINFVIGATANVLLAFVHLKHDTVTATAMTAGGMGMTLLGAGVRSNGGVKEYIAAFGLANPPTGAAVTLAATLSGTPSAVSISAYSAIASPLPATPFGTPSSWGNVGTATAVPAVSSAVGDLIVGAITSNGDFAPAAGQTQIGVDATATNYSAEMDDKPGAAGTTSMSWTCAFSRDYAAIVVPIKAPANTAPTVAINEAGQELPVGASFDYTASASDTEDGDLTASIAWTVSDAAVLSITGATTGGSTTVKKIGAGSAALRANVSDSNGTPAPQASVTISEPATGGTTLILEDEMQQEVRQAGVATKVRVALFDTSGTRLTTNPLAAGDVKISINDGAPVITAGDAGLAALVMVNGLLPIPLDATELPTAGDRVTLLIQDQDGTAYRTRSIEILVFGGNPATPETSTDIKNTLEASGGKLDTLTTRLSAIRAGYLDALAVSGLVAAQTDVQSLQFNTRVDVPVPPQLIRPATGSPALVYEVPINLYDSIGNMEAPDSTPTLTAALADGTDLSANVGALTNPGTGRYVATYTIADTHPKAQVIFTLTVVEGGVSRTYTRSFMVVEDILLSFTLSDRGKLDAIMAQTDLLPADPAGVSDLPPDVSTNVAAIKLKTDTLPANPAAVGSAMTLEAGERTNLASAIANHVETAGALSLDEIGQFLQVIHAGSTSGATANGGTIVWEHPTIPGWSLTFTADKYGNRASAGTLVKP